jgi:pyruvate dehydrogenase (quinone)
LESAVDHYKKARKHLDDLATPESIGNRTHPQYVASLISELASDDAIFTCDVGSPTVWAARYLKMNGKRRFLGSFNHGSMANAMPQAIGAQASHPGRQVVSLSGDGGLAMLLGDLLTLKQLNLPVKVIVFKNDSLAFVELEMKASGFVDFGTNLENPDFAKLAEAAGIAGFSADSPDQVRAALSDAFQHNGPAVVSVSVARQELSMPPTITLEQAKSFGLFMVKAVLDGRFSEIVDLAATNLWH